MAGRSIHLTSVLALSLWVLPAGPAAAGEAVKRVPRSITVQEPEEPAAEPAARPAGAGLGAKPAQNAPPIRKTMPEDTLQQNRETGPPAAGPSLRGRGMVPVAFECSPGFAKEIRPDHPGGFYSCRLPASPACAVGYVFADNPNEPNRFLYKCLDAEVLDSGEEVCAPGWTMSSSGGYRCLSSKFRCGAGHQLDPTRYPPHRSGSRNYVYSYRCNAR